MSVLKVQPRQRISNINIYLYSVTSPCTSFLGPRYVCYYFRHERKMFDKYQKASRACPDKKEREEIEMLKTQVRFQDFKNISFTYQTYNEPFLGQFMFGSYCICIKSYCSPLYSFGIFHFILQGQIQDFWKGLFIYIMVWGLVFC